MNLQTILKLSIALVSLLTSIAQAAPQLLYIPLATPCRVVDTRGFASPFEAGKLTQSFRAWGNQAELNAQRDADGSGALAACQPTPGLTPAAMVANLTVAAKQYKAQGNVVAYPAGQTAPDSSLINFQRNNIANASIIALSNNPNQQFEIQAQLFGNQADNQHKADVVVDVMGYFYHRATMSEATAASALSYVPLATACRIVDTRGFDAPFQTDNSRRSFRAFGSQAELNAQRDVDGNQQLPSCQPVSGIRPLAMAANITVSAKRYHAEGEQTGRTTQPFRAWGSKTELNRQRKPLPSACIPESGVEPAVIVANVTAVAKPYHARGNVMAYPFGTAQPVSSLINFDSNNIANASLMTLGLGGGKPFTLQAQLLGHEAGNQGKVDTIVDVTGYFYPLVSPVSASAGSTTQVSATNSYNHSISADGRFVAYSVTFAGINLQDRKNGETEIIATRGYVPAINADARVVVFSAIDNDHSPT